MEHSIKWILCSMTDHQEFCLYRISFHRNPTSTLIPVHPRRRVIFLYSSYCVDQKLEDNSMAGDIDHSL